MEAVEIVVIGGGITGRLFNFLIPQSVVYDWMPNPRTIGPLTRNFGANYLWRPLDGIHCRAFSVVTHVDGQPPTLEAVQRYKEKIGKRDDVAEWERQFQLHMVGYDFEALPSVPIQYDHRVTRIDVEAHTLHFAKQGDMRYDTLISTIPLYALLALMGWPEPPGGLRYKPIYFKVTARPPDAPFPAQTMYVNYLSDPAITPYRFCDRARERHYESIEPYDGPSTKRIAPGKIYSHPQVPELLALLEAYDIHTFGRYGSWSPDELVHETFRDIQDWRASWDDVQEAK